VGPVSTTRWPPVKLKPASFLILGMVRLGARSGYAIKKVADISTRYFWPTSLAQVYPELARLEQAGLLTRQADPEGGRERFAYELTDEGEAALLAWLASPREAEAQFRDEGILRLFFADSLPLEDQISLVRRLRERARAGSEETREEILPRAEALEQTGTRFPALVGRLRIDTYAFVDQWLAEAEAELTKR
jgi:DNA-binding PadR family transcriptional regulator